MKAKLKLLIDSKDTRNKFGENAGKRVIENFYIGSVTDKVLKIYQDVINRAS